MRKLIGVVLVVAVVACGEKDDAAGTSGASSAQSQPDEPKPRPIASEAMGDMLPKGYVLPRGGELTDRANIGDAEKFVVTYAGGSVPALADELRSGHQRRGWTVTHDSTERERHFVTLDKDGFSVAATVFATPEPTISLSVTKVAPKPDSTSDSASDTASDRTGKALLDAFPVPPEATRDRGYPPTPGPRAERLLVVRNKAPSDLVSWVPDASKAAGWRCTDLQAGRFVCERDGDKRPISVRAVAHPQGGTAFFLAVLPGS